MKRYRKQMPWIKAMQQLFIHYQKIGDDFQALKVALIVANALPYLEHPQYIAGQMLMRAGRAREARRYLKRAAELAANEGKSRR